MSQTGAGAVIVTGAAARRSIGRACAVHLLTSGQPVAIVDVAPLDLDDADDAEAWQCGTREILEAALKTGQLTVCTGSVSDPLVAQQAVTDVLQRHGRLTGLVNMAGIVAPTDFLDICRAELERVFEVNVTGTLLMCQAALPAMVKAGNGSIVNVSSVAALTGGGVFGGTHYAASKAAVEAMTRGIAREFTPQGVRCNAVAPGYVDTDLVTGRLSADQRDQILARSLVRRAGQPSEVARTVSFLLSEAASNITGTVLDVNGGMYFR